MATLLQSVLSGVGLGRKSQADTQPPPVDKRDADSNPNTQEPRNPAPSTGATPEPVVRNWVSNMWAKVRTSYLTYHQMVWQSILFYVGQTWVTWDPYRKLYYPSVPEDEFTPQPRINRFSPSIDAIATNFNTIPSISFIAADSEGDEQYKRHGIASVASSLAADFIKKQGMKSDFNNKPGKPTKAAMDFVLSGSLYTRLHLIDKSRQTPLGIQQLKEVDMELESAIYVMPRPGSEGLGTRAGTPWLFIARRQTIDEAWNRHKIVVTADQQFLDAYNSTYENAINFYYTGFNALDIQHEDSALIVELFIPPGSNDSAGVKDFYNTGLYAIYANEKLQRYDDWDFPTHPITKFDYISVPRMFFARSVAFDLVNLQELLQQYEAIIQLHAMTNAVSPWVVDANSLVGEITGRADKVVKWRSLGPGAIPPHREAPGSLDQGVYMKLGQIKEEFENISGAASVFRGRAEGAITAGSAIAQLRGQAEQMFSGPQTNWINGWKETVRKAIIWMQATYTFEQITEIVGGYKATAIRDFLDCPDLDTAIECISGQHGLPRTQDEVKQEMLNLFDRGALDISAVEVRERIYELFGETGIMNEFNLDATRARMENKGMKQIANPLQPGSGPVPPTFMPMIEDMTVHYKIHSEAIKSIEFDALPEQNKQMLIQHTMQTKMAMMQMQLMENGMMPPPGGAAPNPSAPQKQLPAPTGHHPASGTGHLASQGKPTGGTQHHGQGIQPLGASKGAPPAQPSNPLAPSA